MGSYHFIIRIKCSQRLQQAIADELSLLNLSGLQLRSVGEVLELIDTLGDISFLFFKIKEDLSQTQKDCAVESIQMQSGCFSQINSKEE